MKNPLADPQIVGVSSGAGLAGVIIFILFPGYDHIVPLVAFLGCYGCSTHGVCISMEKMECDLVVLS